MLSNEDFVKQSIDLNLFFMRIMKEHMLFIQAAFTPKNTGLIQQSIRLENEATRLLAEAVTIANGLVSPGALTSGEIVTPYTANAERATQFYTGIPINGNITRAELSLTPAMHIMDLPMQVQRVTALNQRIMALVTAIIQFKERILSDVLSCRLFTNNYPLLIDHILREARLYLKMLQRFQNRDGIDTIREALEQEQFWNRIMAEHAKFIRGLLDPTEVQLFDTANNFGKEFDALTQEAIAANEQSGAFPKVTQDSLQATENIRNFKRQGTEGILNCKIRSIIVPLLGDHVLREANHYLRLLKLFSGQQ